ncbi:hypothetical protein DFJ74DRAFT_708164 [Hyaloraphidium curvatum]|nr:hypothetical protein DFJ74DRAFT_708164 [Hyaloraphidium curvatum]
MSWKGFKKAVERLPHQVMGGGATTVDEDFNELESELKHLETCATKLRNDAEKFKEAVHASLDHQEKMAQVLSEAYQPIPSRVLSPTGQQRELTQASEESQRTVQEYADSMRRAKEELIPELDLIDRRIVQPTKDFLEIIGNIKKLIVKRGHKLLDYDRHRLALQKAKERKDRQAADERRIAELEQKFEQATREYTTINNALLSELPTFLQYRVHFVDPCFQTLFAVQLRVHRTMADTFYRLAQNTCDLTTSPLEGFERRKGEGEQLLGELTILKGSWKTAAGGPTPQGSTDDLAYGSPVRSNARGSQDGLEEGQQAPPPYESAKLFPAPQPAAAGPAGPRKQAPPPPAAKKKPMVQALYDFEAQQQGDLSFRKGDQIEILERTADVNDWWTGRIGNREGQFPGNYVAEL